ncbi:hypothetical protein [Desulfofundulus kuznetsovii]|uniref:hypothetical protein n=1 Tax=Desulfofundulus kuznetsovii TaxID=58135 RepID=UPI00338FE4EF
MPHYFPNQFENLQSLDKHFLNEDWKGKVDFAAGTPGDLFAGAGSPFEGRKYTRQVKFSLSLCYNFRRNNQVLKYFYVGGQPDGRRGFSTIRKSLAQKAKRRGKEAEKETATGQGNSRKIG